VEEMKLVVVEVRRLVQVERRQVVVGRR